MRGDGHAVSNEWIGHVLRKRLHLATHKSNGVYVVPNRSVRKLLPSDSVMGVEKAACPELRLPYNKPVFNRCRTKFDRVSKSPRIGGLCVFANMVAQSIRPPSGKPCMSAHYRLIFHFPRLERGLSQIELGNFSIYRLARYRDMKTFRAVRQPISCPGTEVILEHRAQPFPHFTPKSKTR